MLFLLTFSFKCNTLNGLEKQAARRGATNTPTSLTRASRKLSNARPKLAKGERPKISGLNPPIVRDGEGLTETAKNSRLRGDRRDVWLEADAVIDYWHLSMKMDSVISRVQRHGTPEGDLHPTHDPKNHWRLVAKYREAWAHLMLTPAPDAKAVVWKRAQLKAGRHKYTDLTTERIERAIADDVEFLRAHPTRRGGRA